jgi:hypothetical protein
VSMKSPIFWAVMPCVLVEVLEEHTAISKHSVTLFACMAYSLTLNMEAVCSSKTSIIFYQTVWCLFQADSTLQNHIDWQCTKWGVPVLSFTFVSPFWYSYVEIWKHSGCNSIDLTCMFRNVLYYKRGYFVILTGHRFTKIYSLTYRKIFEVFWTDNTTNHSV